MLRDLWKSMFGPRENPYAHLVAASLAASQARFYTWEFEPETKSIDPNTATVEQLSAALSDCWRCTATEYPETKDGSDWASDRADELTTALQRFPDQAKAVIDAARHEASWASHIAHGGPRPRTLCQPVKTESEG